MDLDFAGLKDFIFSDDSIKTIVFFLALDMRNRFKRMDQSISDLAKSLGAQASQISLVEKNHDERITRLETQMELKTTTQGG